MPRHKFRIKNTDNTKQLAREKRRLNRLNSIKHELESGRMNSFEQIFAIMTETRLATELGISYYAFRKKITDPGEFTIAEMMRMASLFGVNYEVIAVFMLDRIKSKAKSKMFR